MSDLENLVGQVAKIINNEEVGTVGFTSLDTLHAYGLTELDPERGRLCNFQIIEGRATGTYAFKTGIYGLTIMPSEFQKIMDTLLHNIPNTIAFFEDILIVTKGN